MKKLLSCLLLLTTLAVQAQVYNNEWIDHSKTYYKFKVGKDGWYRIQGEALAAAGLGQVPAEHFQLWRNGVEVPIMPNTDGSSATPQYIDFWGKMNDGKPDKALYRDPGYQLNDKWSLQTDTATYFLTVNPSGNNKRFTNMANNVAANTLPAEPYFMHTEGKYFRDRLNGGFFLNVGQNLYSSSYDIGEGWSSQDITTGNSNTFTFGNLFVAPEGPEANLKISVSGNAWYLRYARVRVNGDSVLRFPFDFLNQATHSIGFPVSKIATNAAAIEVANICNLDSCVTNDRMVIHQAEMTYPRQFNFGNATSFEFTMPASATARYLEIKGFNNSSGAPVVLLDLTNQQRYVADISTPGVVKIVLSPSTTPRQLVLYGVAAGINVVNTLQSRQFMNYSIVTNQADYLIISNRQLFTNTDGSNPVEDYRAYRSSNTGGAFNARIFDVDELVDQFGFGIKKHPVAIRNFILYARRQFAVKPVHVFIIGKGVNYVAYRGSESHVNMESLNLVPTFGLPASDALLTADPGSSVPQLSYGRLSAINGAEVATYLKKVKETELGQVTLSPNRQDRAWMKNVVHINGISEPKLKNDINGFYNKYKSIIADTLFGARVTTFSKTSTDAVEQISSSFIPNLFKEGISLITYFGHSSSSGLEFNLETPASYQNQGKYPLFVALGCYVGDFFTFNTKRLVDNETLTEKYVLAPNRGTIGFVASTHYGIVHYLDIWNTEAYKTLSRTHYGSPIGEILKVTAKKMFGITSEEDFYARCNIEQMELHGDPAIKVNPHAKPDYLIEESFIKINPEFISIAETSVKVSVRLMNIGKAVADSIVVEARRQYPDQTTELVFNKTIAGIRYMDSLDFQLPIESLRDKGINKLTISVDAGNAVDELFETNNTITKEFIVYEDEIRPVYPYDFSIVNKQNIKMVASTANAFSALKNYRMEMDTTELFNSPLKVTKNVSSIGGAIEFEPGLAFTNNTVYYWRVAHVVASGVLNWKTASFIYLPGHDAGFSQSHLYQHLKSERERIELDSTSKTWKFGKQLHNLFSKNAMFPTGGNLDSDFSLALDGDAYIRSACVGRSLVFNIIDPKSFRPWRNVDENGNNLFLYGSGSANCRPGREFNFEFSYMTSADRKKIMDFMDSIPFGFVVSVRSHDYSVNNSYAATWRADTSLFGSENSLYHKLLKAGFVEIDSIDKPRAWALIYQKGIEDFEIKYDFTEGIYDKITVSTDVAVPSSRGYIISPKFGPAKAWKQFIWEGKPEETKEGDKSLVSILGIQQNGLVDTLYKDLGIDKDVIDISSINPIKYPYVQLIMENIDSINFTPYQLQKWQLTYDPVPEGALAPNIYLQMRDTVEYGEPLEFRIAFKNVSETSFDSVKVKLVVVDRNNESHVLQNLRYKPLEVNDTLTVIQPIESKQFIGLNALVLEVNPEKDQPEQYHFNNIAYKNFYVVADSLDPLLDVTFDNVHILNNDIVSPKPDILIKLKDEAKWSLLNDTSMINVRVKYPNGTTRTFFFNNHDTLQFSGARAGTENIATIRFKPYFEQDGTYELTVSGRDGSDNKTGNVDYRVAFEVYNKAMISNLLNYPNPFTTSTAFVFTLTGSEVPQEFKIQILTITGKVVREITRQELGPIKIGRNITEFKWDGTDQFGQKLANGVYLYRVVTSLDGKTLEKFSSKNTAENTDKYFNKGYGKMYLMR